jgi:hypothetical protein
LAANVVAVSSELLRATPRIARDDRRAAGATAHLFQVHRQPVRRFRDRPLVDRRRAELGHRPATSAGAERNLLPEQILQPFEIPPRHQRRQLVTILRVVRLFEPPRQVPACGIREFPRTPGLIDNLQ